MLNEFTAFAGAWWRARRLDRLDDRENLLGVQRRWLERHLAFVAAHSPYYRDCARMPLQDWPVMHKEEWMRRFDDINTIGARRDELEAFAMQAEAARDFSRTWRGHAVGFSTGTSGHRGMFVAGSTERARWAGTLLGRMLRPGLRGQRVALVLRAGSPLYERASALNLGFRYFDQARPWDDIVRELVRFRPTMLVAPARVLAMLAAHAPRLRPERVVSVAEVLDELDRKRIEAAFGCRVEQIYQATEGLLGITCEQGTLHLMEPWVLVEPLWLDEARTRCTPLVTDLWRRTQPVIRYRLNDVWRVSCAPCGCGRAALALDGVDGRMDDLLWLDGQRGEVCVFPDLLTRGIVMATESLVDYEVVEMARGQWRVALDPLPDDAACRRIIERLQALAASLGAYAPGISVVAMNGVTGIGKQRRVRGLRSAPCAY